MKGITDIGRSVGVGGVTRIGRDGGIRKGYTGREGCLGFKGNR